MSSPFECINCGHKHNLSKNSYQNLISYSEDIVCGQCGKKLEPQKADDNEPNPFKPSPFAGLRFKDNKVAYGLVGLFILIGIGMNQGGENSIAFVLVSIICVFLYLSKFDSKS